jgi:hypothetical protein
MKRAKSKRVRKRADGYPVPRVYHRKARGKKSARLLIKCGDCGNKFEIYYGPQGEDLEIAGVLASVENWRRILLPLLKKGAGRPSETGYLLRSAANAKRLITAINASNRGAVPPRMLRS